MLGEAHFDDRKSIWNLSNESSIACVLLFMGSVQPAMQFTDGIKNSLESVYKAPHILAMGYVFRAYSDIRLNNISGALDGLQTLSGLYAMARNINNQIFTSLLVAILILFKISERFTNLRGIGWGGSTKSPFSGTAKPKTYPTMKDFKIHKLDNGDELWLNPIEMDKSQMPLDTKKRVFQIATDILHSIRLHAGHYLYTPFSILLKTLITRAAESPTSNSCPSLWIAEHDKRGDFALIVAIVAIKCGKPGGKVYLSGVNILNKNNIPYNVGIDGPSILF